MSAKWMKAVNITSSLSKREKILLKPLSRRNNRSISLRRRYMTRSYCHGLTRPCLGGTTGVNPSSNRTSPAAGPRAARSSCISFRLAPPHNVAALGLEVYLRYIL